MSGGGIRLRGGIAHRQCKCRHRAALRPSWPVKSRVVCSERRRLKSGMSVVAAASAGGRIGLSRWRVGTHQMTREESAFTSLSPRKASCRRDPIAEQYRRAHARARCADSTPARRNRVPLAGMVVCDPDSGAAWPPRREWLHGADREGGRRIMRAQMKWRRS